ncbi:MAG: YkgJ family cysteine cluster protein [Thermodesulfobacteriota bacterium]|nr:YkgJ family cysteine cluster protein [Thermodesulfobacteriota bacterium]
MIPISLDDPFTFSCSAEVPCFNECCRDLNQFLTPYDILCLKNYLDMTSGAFLERYTTRHTGPESGLPVIALKPGDALKCPFVTESGCSVYDSRPSSCRMYPLARAVSRSRETSQITEHFALLKEPHCRGFEQENTQTVRQWITDQKLAGYNEMNDRLMEIISLKNLTLPGPLDMKSSHLFHLALYDLDRFRIHIFEKGLLDDFNFDSAVLEAVKNDDVELLKLGHRWIKKILFGDI